MTSSKSNPTVSACRQWFSNKKYVVPLCGQDLVFHGWCKSRLNIKTSSERISFDHPDGSPEYHPPWGDRSFGAVNSAAMMQKMCATHHGKEFKRSSTIMRSLSPIPRRFRDLGLTQWYLLPHMCVLWELWASGFLFQHVASHFTAWTGNVLVLQD